MKRVLIFLLMVGVCASLASAAGSMTVPGADAPQPRLSINDISVAEGDTGTTAATFTVSLDVSGDQDVTVHYATADGTARRPGDYQQASGNLTIPEGETSRPVTVQVVGNTLDEANETFRVNLSNPEHASIEDGEGIATITDDDDPSALSINDRSVQEGDSGDVNAVFTVSLDRASETDIRVDYATADGTAEHDGDYQHKDGTLTFHAGETARTLTVKVRGDTLDEPDELYFVNLSNPENGTIADGQGVGTIIDDDGSPPPPPPRRHRHRLRRHRRHLRRHLLRRHRPHRRRRLAAATAAGTTSAAASAITASGSLPAAFWRTDVRAAPPGVARGSEGALLQRPALSKRQKDAQRLAKAIAPETPPALDLPWSRLAAPPRPLHVARLARIRHEHEPPLRSAAWGRQVSDRLALGGDVMRPMAV